MAARVDSRVALKNGSSVDPALLNAVYQQLKYLKEHNNKILYDLIKKCSGVFRISLEYISFSKPELQSRHLVDPYDHVPDDIRNIVLSAITPYRITVSEHDYTDGLALTNPSATNTWEWLKT